MGLLALQRNDLISQDQKTLSELKFNLDHLGSNVKKKVQTLIDKYDDVWARESRKTGTFKYFKVSLEVDSERLHVGMQKNRNTDFQRSPEARQVIQQLLKERVLIPAPSQFSISP